MANLEDKVAIVTGRGTGIERAISLLYATEGAKLVVSDVDEKGGNETVGQIEANGGGAVFVKADNSKPDDSKKAVEVAIKTFGGLHITVDNAGIGSPLGPVG